MIFRVLLLKDWGDDVLLCERALTRGEPTVARLVWTRQPVQVTAS